MSTGADCHFTEVEPGRWTYWLQDWPYGDWPQGQTFGPFDGFQQAHDHLRNNHANPGGYSTRKHPDHRHEEGTIVRRKPDDSGWDWNVPGCPACGQPKEIAS